MGIWQEQDAEANFSEFLEAALKEGPQIVTKRGIETAVLLPIEEWRRLQHRARRSIKELVLAAEPRFDGLIPPRRLFRRRPTLRLK